MNNSFNGQQAHCSGMNQDWQTDKSTVVERAKHLLHSGLHADCEFLIGAYGSNQEVLQLFSFFFLLKIILILTIFYKNLSLFTAHQGSQNISGPEQSGT